MYNLIIIGGGVAGMTAALYAKRAGKSVLLIEKETIGGQIATSPKVENYPTVKEISGLDLSNNLFDQITDLGVEFDLDDVLSIDKKDDHFIVTTKYQTYEAETAIIATGVKHRTLGLPREDELVGKGISYCAVCDGSFYQNQDVAVIGDANSALQYALMLADTSSSVTLCMLFDKFFAEDALVKKVICNNKIKVIKNISLQEYLGEDELTGLRFKNTVTDQEVIVPCKGVFIAIGQVPGENIYHGLVDLDNKGYIISNDTTTKTEGLYVAGDIRTKDYRQVTTAMADGAIAALNAVNYLNKK